MQSKALSAGNVSARGATDYLNNCAACRLSSETVRHSTLGNSVVNAGDASSLINIVLPRGGRPSRRPTRRRLTSPCPPFGDHLSDAAQTQAIATTFSYTASIPETAASFEDCLPARLAIWAWLLLRISRLGIYLFPPVPIALPASASWATAVEPSGCSCWRTACCRRPGLQIAYRPTYGQSPGVSIVRSRHSIHHLRGSRTTLPSGYIWARA